MRNGTWHPAIWGICAAFVASGCAGLDKKISLSDVPLIPELYCKKAIGPIIIDGSLNEPCWKDAVQFTGFRIAETGDMARTQARIYFLYDDDFLYLAGEMEDQDLYADLEGPDQMCWTWRLWKRSNNAGPRIQDSSEGRACLTIFSHGQQRGESGRHRDPLPSFQQMCR